MKIYNWKELSLVQIGGLISSPILLVGYTLGSHFSFLTCFSIILFGNLVIYIIAYYYASIFINFGLSTVELALKILGERGGKICAVTLFLTMSGWAALQTSIITESLSIYSVQVTRFIPIIIIGLSCILCRKKLNLIANFNLIISPLLFGLLFYALYLSYVENGIAFLPKKDNFQIKKSLFLVICTALGMVFDLPTFYKNASSPKDTYISITLLFAIFLPLIELIGCIFAFISNKSTLSNLPFLLQLSSSKLFLLAFVMSGIACNCINLFSSSVIIHNSFKKLNFNKSIFVSFFSTYLLYLLLEKINIIDYLEIINTSIVILGSILIFYSFKNSKQSYRLDESQKFTNEIIFYLSLLVSSLFYFFRIDILGNILMDLVCLVMITLFVFSNRKLSC